MATPIIDLNDLEVAMNRTFNDGTAAQALYYIDLITSFIIGYTGVSFTAVTGATLRARADAYGTINIDFEPVAGVTSVTDYQTQIELTNWIFDGLDCVLGLWPFQVVDIVFDYGMAAPPDDIIGVCTEAAKRAVNSFPAAGGPVKQHAVGDVIDVYDTFRTGSNLGQFFSAGDMTILDNYKETNRTLRLGAEGSYYNYFYNPYPYSNYPEIWW